MADILALVLQHDERLVEQAVREAIESGVLTKTHILNRLATCWMSHVSQAGAASGTGHQRRAGR